MSDIMSLFRDNFKNSFAYVVEEQKLANRVKWNALSKYHDDTHTWINGQL